MSVPTLIAIGILTAVLVNIALGLAYFASFLFSKTLKDEIELQKNKAKLRKAKKSHTVKSLTESMKESAF